MLARGWRRAILVTDPFHSRRALLTFRAVWRATDLEVLASPADDSEYGVALWWTSPSRGLTIVKEYLKFAYYAALRRL